MMLASCRRLCCRQLEQQQQHAQMTLQGGLRLWGGQQARALHVLRDVQAVRAFLRHSESGVPDRPAFFVPTMGYLHQGHLSLVHAARADADKFRDRLSRQSGSEAPPAAAGTVDPAVVASIYVNPTQFAAHEDLDVYPRDEARDLRLLEEAGVDAVFAPAPGTSLYGAHHRCFVEPRGFDTALAEGRARPDFFRGVATVVCKLFNIVRPTRAYFGQKDVAQTVLIRRLVADLDMDGTEVVVRPTIREEDGLACSSRNTYLNEKERAAAPVVSRSLARGHAAFHAVDSAHAVTANDVVHAVRAELESEPMVEEIEYISIADPETMDELPGDGALDRARGAVLSLAVKVGKVRLIDNEILRALV